MDALTREMDLLELGLVKREAGDKLPKRGTAFLVEGTTDKRYGRLPRGRSMLFQACAKSADSG